MALTLIELNRKLDELRTVLDEELRTVLAHHAKWMAKMRVLDFGINLTDGEDNDERA